MFLEHAVTVFLKVLGENEAQFLAEHSGQQLRKLILEIIHRLPVNDTLRKHVQPILSLMFRLLEVGLSPIKFVVILLLVEIG